MFRTAGAFFQAALQQQLTYRVANWAGLFTNCFFLFFRAMVLIACYEHRDDIGGLDVMDAATYATVTQAILMVVPQWGAVGVSDSVRSGQIAVELLKPVDFVDMYLARRLGVSTYYVAFRMLPILAIGWMAGLLRLPDPAMLPLFAVSVVLGAWVANCLLFLVEVSSFWLEAERGIRYIVLGASLLPSGLLLPLQYFPDAAQFLFRCTPFPYTMFVPADVWLGGSSPGALVGAIGIQAAWAIGLTVACKWAFARGTARLQVLGG